MGSRKEFIMNEKEENDASNKKKRRKLSNNEQNGSNKKEMEMVKLSLTIKKKKKSKRNNNLFDFPKLIDEKDEYEYEPYTPTVNLFCPHSDCDDNDVFSCHA